MEKKKPFKIKYRQLRLKIGEELTYDYVLRTFDVACPCLKNEPLEGFNKDVEEQIIETLLNNGWYLVSVSEDEKSICYHLIFREKIEL